MKKLLDTKWKGVQIKKHKLGTYEIDKISLVCFGDKRYVLDDGIRTLAYFHKNSYKIVKRLKKVVIKNTVIKKMWQKRL